MDKRADLALAVITAVLGAVIIALTTQVSTTLVIDPVGSRGFGYFIGAALVVGGAVIAVQRIRAWDAHGETTQIPSEGAGDEPDVPASPVRPLIVVGATLLYAWSLGFLGFLLATPVYLGFLLTLLKAQRPVLSRIVLPFAFTIVVYLVFAQGLDVNIPVGPFRPLFREWGLIRF